MLLKVMSNEMSRIFVFIWLVRCVRLSPRELTIAGINQNHITHAGEINSQRLT